MKVVCAPDSFKESMSAAEAAAAMTRGVRSVFPDAQCVEVPMADGGEGTTAALMAALEGQWRTVRTADALGRRIEARYGLTADGLAVIEVAESVGIGLVEPHVPHSRLPEVWNLPVSQFLAATGLPTGWGWLAFAHRGDIANLLLGGLGDALGTSLGAFGLGDPFEVFAALAGGKAVEEGPCRGRQGRGEIVELGGRPHGVVGRCAVVGHRRGRPEGPGVPHLQPVGRPDLAALHRPDGAVLDPAVAPAAVHGGRHRRRPAAAGARGRRRRVSDRLQVHGRGRARSC